MVKDQIKVHNFSQTKQTVKEPTGHRMLEALLVIIVLLLILLVLASYGQIAIGAEVCLSFI
jgi:hypothetical protein